MAMTRVRAGLIFAGLLLGSPAGAWADAVFGWGANGGQLGDGAYDPRPTPFANPNLPGGVSGVAAGSMSGYAIKGGAAYGWGLSQFGQIGNNTVSVSSEPNPQPLPLLPNGVTAIAGGNVCALAIRNGALYGWGFNGYGQLGLGDRTNRFQPVAVPGLASGVTAISSGESGGNGSYFSLAVRNGTAYGFGYNGFGQIGNGTNADQLTPVPLTGLNGGVSAVSAGGFHSLAVRNGAVYAWGYNGYGQLGTGNKSSTNAPAATTVLSDDVTAIAAGTYHSLAVRNGQVYSWGFNDNGELGLGDTAGRTTPTLVPGLTNITDVAANNLSSYALSTDGSLWVWGSNSLGQLGVGGAMDNRLSPVHLLPPTGFVFTDISANSNFVLAMAVPVPEPTVAGLGVAGVLLLRRRRGAVGSSRYRLAI